MIEVEKKFQPTPEQLKALVNDCKLEKEVINQDIYYDFPDYRMIRKGTRLRRRNGRLELKVSDKNEDANEGDGGEVSLELEDEKEIKKYLNIDLPLEEYIKSNLIVGMNIKTTRQQYRKDDFIIDVDRLDFGYDCVEIELLVHDKSEVSLAYAKIIDFAKSYGLEIKKIPPKKKEYFRIVKPEVYKLIYG